jgi:hypothetical protein
MLITPNQVPLLACQSIIPFKLLILLVIFSVCIKQSNEGAGTSLVLWMYLLRRGTYFPAQKIDELILLLFCILLSTCLVAAIGKSF